MNLENIRNNKVKVILRFSIPSIIAMVLTSLITVADGFFIGHYVGKEGMAAVNLGLPIVYLYLAVGLMVSVGGIAIAGMAYGAGEKETCNDVFNQTMITTVVVSIAISIIAFFCFEPMLNLLHADGIVADYFRQYYKILLFQLPVMIVNSSLGMFIRGEGNPQFYMKINIANVLLNILLDYLFARWLYWGVSGIAAASLISTVATFVGILYYFTKKSIVYKFQGFTFSKQVLRNTILNGCSEFIGEMSMCISMFAYNYVIMRRIGVDGVTAFTIVGYVSYIFSMIIVGFGQGASPLMSFTYGAGEHKLAVDIRKKSNQFVFSAGVIVILFMYLISGWYSTLFVDNESVRHMVHSGLMIFVLSFLCSGINTITSFYFTSIGKAKESAVISFSRGLVILLACIFILPVFLEMTGIWMAAPVTEAITLMISFCFIIKEKNREHYLCGK